MRVDAQNQESLTHAEHHRIVPISVPAPRLTSDDAGVTLSNGTRLEFRSREMQRVIDALIMRMILGGDILNVIASIEVQIIKFTNCRDNLFPQLFEFETCQMKEIQQQVRSLS